VRSIACISDVNDMQVDAAKCESSKGLPAPPKRKFRRLSQQAPKWGPQPIVKRECKVVGTNVHVRNLPHHVINMGGRTSSVMDHRT
jgi:hypothetical protein